MKRLLHLVLGKVFPFLDRIFGLETLERRY